MLGSVETEGLARFPPIHKSLNMATPIQIKEPEDSIPHEANFIFFLFDFLVASQIIADKHK